MAKTIDFRIRGDDPSLGKIKGLIEGVAFQAGDKTLVMQETRLISVTTEREDVAAILTNLAKIGKMDGEPKKKYQRRANTATLEPFTGTSN